MPRACETTASGSAWVDGRGWCHRDRNTVVVGVFESDVEQFRLARERADSEDHGIERIPMRIADGLHEPTCAVFTQIDLTVFLIAGQGVVHASTIRWTHRLCQEAGLGDDRPNTPIRCRSSPPSDEGQTGQSLRGLGLPRLWLTQY